MLPRSCRMAFRCPPELLLRTSIRNSKPSVSMSAAASSGATYRAALCREIGKPMTVESLERKPLGYGEVRLKVKHAAINFGDILMVQGKYQSRPELPFTPGTELAGEVIEVGEGVENLKLGDRVMGTTGPNVGAQAEETSVPEMAVTKIPDSVSTDVAASVTISYCTAWMALTRRANVKPGDTVLVTAAAGAVGLATVDLAANVFKCKVIGACGSDEKCQLVKKYGAVEAINYNKEKIPDKVKQLTEFQGADIIVDNVGGDIFTQCLKSIAFEGRLIINGFAGGEIPKIPANILLVKNVSAVGLFWGSYSARNPPVFQESISAIASCLQKGQITPHACRSFPLDQINEAYQYIMQRKSTGKVLVQMT